MLKGVPVSKTMPPYLPIQIQNLGIVFISWAPNCMTRLKLTYNGRTKLKRAQRLSQNKSRQITLITVNTCTHLVGRERCNLYNWSTLCPYPRNSRRATCRRRKRIGERRDMGWKRKAFYNSGFWGISFTVQPCYTHACKPELAGRTDLPDKEKKRPLPIGGYVKPWHCPSF